MVHKLHMAQPTQSDPQFKLRLPTGLRERIKTAAEANNRSMNAEIVAVLEEAFPEPAPKEIAAQLIALIDQMLREKAKTVSSREEADRVKSAIERMQRVSKLDPDDHYAWDEQLSALEALISVLK